jgi:glycerate dehydrogenase
MNLVVLDGFTLNQGDLSWEPFHQFGHCTVYHRTLPHELLSRAQNAEILLTNKCRIDAAALGQLEQIKYIGVLATGHDVVDSRTARLRGIDVCNIPGYGTFSVAEHTFALILELARHAGEYSQQCRAGRWSESPDWCYWDRPLVELSGLTLGIVGWGAIGQRVATIGQAFGMTILVHSRREIPGYPRTTLEDLFRKSDVVSLHCPLTAETRQLVDANRLALMKPTAFLVNTSRGALVDEQSLAAALDNGWIAGAAVDVLANEPPPPNYPLLQATNCICTPHIAWASRAARQRLMVKACDNIRAFLAGAPINLVN